MVSLVFRISEPRNPFGEFPAIFEMVFKSDLLNVRSKVSIPSSSLVTIDMRIAHFLPRRADTNSQIELDISKKCIGIEKVINMVRVRVVQSDLVL